MNTACLPRPSNLSLDRPLTINHIQELLQQYVQKTGATVDLLLIGGLALQAYGFPDRATRDVDGELKGDLEALVNFFHDNHIPADLGENISGWSVVAMPPGYRERSTLLMDEQRIQLRLLHPVDFIIAKLRRGTELDLEDAMKVAQRFAVTAHAVREAGELAIAASPQDTALFIFRKILELFCAKLAKEE